MFDNTLTEDKLAAYEINLSAASNGEITESFLSMFGGALKEILRRMFGEVPDMDTIKQALRENEDKEPQIVIKGTQCEIDSLATTLAAEKSYMETNFERYATSLTKVITEQSWTEVEILARAIFNVWQERKQFFLCGNGGSAGNAIHLANDFLYGVAREIPVP